MISLSEDGGKTFKIIVPYSGIHPDHHAFWIHPNDPNLIIDGNDGGIGISRDRGKTWKFDEQLPVGQFYHINTDNEIPYHVMGGMQDNGSWRGPAYSWTEGGIRNYYWQSLWGGDGFDVSPDPQDSKWVYAMSQGGELGKYNVVTGQSMGLQPPPSNLKTKLRFNWNAAFAQSPQSPSTIYYASQFVHKSSNKGLDWETISPDLTTNDSAQQNQDNNGGLSVDITGAENYNTIICVEPSAKDSNVLWVGTDDGNVQLTKDGGKTWTNFRGKIPGMPLGAWVPQIRASRHNVAEAFVVCNDYRRGDFQPYIFRTTNFGQTWQRLVDEKKVKGYALSMIQDPTEPNLIFVGTEHGLWMSLDNGVTVKRWKNKYPAVSTYDLAIQEREADLCVATFGRAMYVFDDIRPLRAAAKNKGMNFSKAVTVFPAPTAYQYRERNVLGYDHSSWGMFEGENRYRGASYSFYINQQAFPTSTDTAKKINTDSAWVKIYNEKNDLIRTMKIKIDSGFNRFTWGFEMKGTRMPGSEKPKAGAPEPGGRSVFPGNYKLVLTVANVSDSTIIAVVPDPAVTPNKTIYDAQLKMMDRIEKSNSKLVEITDQLKEAEETITKIESTLKNDESVDADSLRNHGKSMMDSIKNIRNFILGKPQEKQGYGSPYQIIVNDKLQEANWEIMRKEKIPAQQEIRLIEMAESLVNDAIKKSNLFFDGPWKKYEQHANANPIKLFKSYQPIE
jgi:hypothetical protein